MRSKNSIPKPIDEVISLAGKADTAAQAIGEDVPLTINTPAKIAADHYDLVGDPTNPLEPGKQARYAAQKAVLSSAYAEGREVVKAARAFCQLAIDVLAPTLGARWNSRWNAVGFVAPSLAVPRDPVAMLVRLREYFNANPAREVAVLNISAAAAQMHLTAVQASNLAIAQGKGLLASLKTTRDASLAKLRKRLSGLRAELEQVIPADDGRWYDFGFRRPVDGAQPAEVENVTLSPVGAGSILVKWETAALAQGYRVTWKLKNATEPATDAGLTTAMQALLLGLPVGVPLVIAVSARNRSGETEPTEVEITI